jgi:glycosyltransferase involved in cell wall biosynthesis
VKLSALVCAQNDEARLADCLRGLEFCDEIVVVADRCTDRSQEIARHFGARADRIATYVRCPGVLHKK